MTDHILVPREPTEAMLDAGLNAYWGHEGSYREVYRAMLAAAPRQPQGAEPRDMALRLLDNIACATQNRALLTGDPAEDKVLTEAVIDNAEQEFSRILAALSQPAPEAG